MISMEIFELNWNVYGHLLFHCNWLSWLSVSQLIGLPSQNTYVLKSMLLQTKIVQCEVQWLLTIFQ